MTTQTGEKGRLASLLTAVAIAVGVGAIAAALFNAPFYRKLIAEDGIVETLSWLCWFGAAASLAFWLGRNRNAGKIALAMALLAAFCFVCGGEEMSWGQRILGFKTPETLSTINKQNETNLHNIGSISVFSNTFFALATLFFLLPRSEKMRRRFPFLNLVPPSATRIYLITLATWAIIGVRFATLGFSPLSLWGYYSQMDDEIYELFAAFSFFCFALLAPNLRPERENAATPSAGSL